MTRALLLLPAATLLGLSLPAAAEDGDFSLTYHVERTPAAQLSIEACGEAVLGAAEDAGLTSTVQTFPEQLVTVSGGRDGDGSFVVQCIAVGDTTVSVVQGIDYRTEKASLGAFADHAFEEVKAAID